MGNNRIGNFKNFTKLNILLLGVGYLGSELLKYLSKEHRVIALDHGRHYSKLKDVPGINFKNVSLYKGDILNDDLLEKCIKGADVVINLLGGGGNQACLKNPEWAIDTYIIGNQKIIEKVKKHDIKHLILTSSIAVYPKREKEILVENNALAPSNVYGFLKLASEKILKENDISFTILRLSNLYGFNEINPLQIGGALGNFIKASLEGEDILIKGTGGQKIDYVHIRDVCWCIMLLLERNLNKKEVYNIGSGHLKTINEITETISKLAEKYSNSNKKTKIKKIQADDVQDFALMSIEKIKKDIMWEPKINFIQGVEEMIIKFIESGNG